MFAGYANESCAARGKVYKRVVLRWIPGLNQGFFLFHCHNAI